ncbi:MAG: hypothetical protein ACYS0F_15095, partial [Planctomycetota bacterium]|jgi:hypothetical protein
MAFPFMLFIGVIALQKFGLSEVEAFRGATQFHEKLQVSKSPALDPTSVSTISNARLSSAKKE